MSSFPACVARSPSPQPASPSPRRPRPAPAAPRGRRRELAREAPAATGPSRRARAIDLVAARGECEAAQIAVRAPGGLAALSAEAGPLRGRRGAALPARALPRRDALAARARLGPGRGGGRVARPARPRPRRRTSASRGAPSRSPSRPGRLQAIWVEVCVPEDAAAGEHAGAVRLADGARAARRGAGAAAGLAVRAPAHRDLRRGVRPPHARRDARARASRRSRARAGARGGGAPPPRHARTSSPPTRPTATAPPGAARSTGRATTRRSARCSTARSCPGVRGGFAEVRIPARVWDGPEQDLAATLRAWRRHFEERGWADRLWLYTLDEPGPAQLPELRRRARLARAAGIRVFATVVPLPALAGAVDDFAPNLALVVDGAGTRRAVTWSYASCLSHGCDELPGDGTAARASMLREFAGWPGYEIDRPGTAARAVPLLGVRRGLKGELYYDMLQAWTGDPWTRRAGVRGERRRDAPLPGAPGRARRDATRSRSSRSGSRSSGTRSRTRSSSRWRGRRARGGSRTGCSRGSCRPRAAGSGGPEPWLRARLAARGRARAARPAGGAVSGSGRVIAAALLALAARRRAGVRPAAARRGRAPLAHGRDAHLRPRRPRDGEGGHAPARGRAPDVGRQGDPAARPREDRRRRSRA